VDTSPGRQQQPAGGQQPAARDDGLTDLETALQDAMAAAPRTDVMQSVAAALSFDIAAGQDLRNVEAAIQQQIRMNLLGDPADEPEAECWPADEVLDLPARGRLVA
jgi:hypothetical protein